MKVFKTEMEIKLKGKQTMAKILADKNITKLFGSVLIDASEKLLNPNGIKLRLGKQVHFHSTGEIKELEPDMFLKVCPGETVCITSLETIDFRIPTVQSTFSDCTLMALITPTTTMMREGVTQAATKIDAGFFGNLNWGIRNSSTRDLVLQYGEPIFKLTFFLLDKDESPDVPYGERSHDSYQETKGIKRSNRKIPVDIQKSKIISSSLSLLDPQKQLKEAGYPFSHIGTELTDLHGKFEIVSKDVLLMKEEFHRRTTDLSTKIESVTTKLSEKIEETKISVLEKVETLFDKKFIRIAGTIIGVIPFMYGGITFLQSKNFDNNVISFITMAGGIIIIFVAYQLSKHK